MSAPLFLVDALPGVGPYRLDGPEGHHAADVQRLRPGAALLLADGRGGLATATVAGGAVGLGEPRGAGDPRGTRGALDLTVTEVRRVPVPRPRLVAVQGIAKGDRGELAVQAMTEVGVDEIVPWAATRCVVQWRGERGARSLERWRATAREAAKQARRAWLPAVTDPVSTAAVARRPAPDGADAGAVTLVLHEEAEERLTAVGLPDAASEVRVVVGPEGGIAPEEVAQLVRAGAVPVRLGDTVLRTSTAGVAALAVLAARLGRW